MAALYKTLCLCLSLFFLLFSATDATASPGYTAGISLSPGNTIALIAPASPSPESIAPTVKKLESLGFHTKIASSAYKRFGYLSGSDAERADDLNALFADPSVNAILCLDGGYGIIFGAFTGSSYAKGDFTTEDVLKYYATPAGKTAASTKN